MINENAVGAAATAKGNGNNKRTLVKCFRLLTKQFC